VTGPTTLSGLDRGLRSYDAVIFDMDGVVTDTASVHAAAWKDLFDEVLPELAVTPTSSFDISEDYRRYADGRTRADDVRAFLASRGIELSEGEAGDAIQRSTVRGLAARMQELFSEQVAATGAMAFPSSLVLLRRLRAVGLPTALVTSSRNSRAVLEAAGVSDLFDVRVDGSDALLSLPGKPDPAMFLEAAQQLGVDPGRSVVVEDAVAGVRAGAAGGFGLVVGVDRPGNRAEPRRHTSIQIRSGRRVQSGTAKHCAPTHGPPWRTCASVTGFGCRSTPTASSASSRATSSSPSSTGRSTANGTATSDAST